MPHVLEPYRGKLAGILLFRIDCFRPECLISCLIRVIVFDLRIEPVVKFSSIICFTIINTETPFSLISHAGWLISVSSKPLD